MCAFVARKCWALLITNECVHTLTRCGVAFLCLLPWLYPTLKTKSSGTRIRAVSTIKYILNANKTPTFSVRAEMMIFNHITTLLYFFLCIFMRAAMLLMHHFKVGCVHAQQIMESVYRYYIYFCVPYIPTTKRAYSLARKHKCLRVCPVVIIYNYDAYER